MSSFWIKIPCINWQGWHLNIHYTMSPTLKSVWSVVYIVKGVICQLIHQALHLFPMDWLLFPPHPNKPEVRLPLVQKVFLGSWLHFCRFLLSARTTSSIHYKHHVLDWRCRPLLALTITTHLPYVNVGIASVRLCTVIAGNFGQLVIPILYLFSTKSSIATTTTIVLL